MAKNKKNIFHNTKFKNSETDKKREEDKQTLNDTTESETKSNLEEKKLKENEVLKKENLELRELLLRTKADFENYRKRNLKELEESKEKSKISFILELLPVIDNFELSLKMTNNKEAFIKGVQMIHENLIKILEENHLEEFIPQIGEEFNPELHEPLLVESEEGKEGTVIAVLQKGYKHKKNQKIIRPARVKIIKNKKEQRDQQD